MILRMPRFVHGGGENKNLDLVGGIQIYSVELLPSGFFRSIVILPRSHFSG
jgi:hypothetical protein